MVSEGDTVIVKQSGAEYKAELLEKFFGQGREGQPDHFVKIIEVISMPDDWNPTKGRKHYVHPSNIHPLEDE